MDYFYIQTGPPEDKGIRGGLMHRPIPRPRSWIHYVRVESLDETVERVQMLGGKLLRAKAAVPKTAWYAVVQDPKATYSRSGNPIRPRFPTPEPDI